MKKTIYILSFLAAASGLGVVPSHRALNAAEGPGIVRVEAWPTFESIGLRCSAVEGFPAVAAVNVGYRLEGAPDWNPAQPLVRVRGARFAGSIFFLAPGADYEVRLEPFDSAGNALKSLTLRVSTRSEQTVPERGRELFVAPEGSDSNPGSRARPIRTIRHGADMARPGDIVRVLPGAYRETVRITSSGRPDAPISFVAEGRGVVISGADSLYECAGVEGLWRKEQDAVYYSEPGFPTRYVAADGQRLFHYISRAEFDEFVCGGPGGWCREDSSGRLYVRLGSGESPALHRMHLARLDTGIHLQSAHNIVIRGFEIRDFGGTVNGTGIHLDRAANCVVRDCSIHGMNSNVLLTGGATDNLIQGCEIWDTSLSGLPWAMTKNRDEEGGGVLSTDGGRGNVVRGCNLHGLFDGLSLSYWDSLWVEKFNCDWDICDNEISDIRDDAIEIEGPCINVRFWNNYCHDLFTGISLAPINVGPVYVLYNVLWDQKWLSFKYGVFGDSSGQGPCLVYHNTVYSRRPNVNPFVVSRPLAGQVFRNNIFFGTAFAFWTSKEPGPGNDLDYDLWQTSDTEWFQGWTGTQHRRYFHIRDQEIYFLADLQKTRGWELHGLFGDPLFDGPETGDLKLGASSPCVDRGLRLPNINDSFKGAAPDLGAFERDADAVGTFPLGSRLDW